MVVKPRGEVVLGGETRLVDLLFTTARPVAEGLRLFIDRCYRTGDEEAQSPGSLHRPPEQLQLSGGMPSRGSLFTPLQPGRRMLPAPTTPFRFARHLIATGVCAVQLSDELLHPRPKRPSPTQSLIRADDHLGAPTEAGSVTV